MNLQRFWSALLMAVFAAVAAAENYPPEKMDGWQGRLTAAQSISAGLQDHVIRGVKVSEEDSTAVFNRRARMADGTWELAGMYDGFEIVLRHQGNWDQALVRLQEWRTAFPASRTAAVAEATYWIAYADLARGDGYASEVPPMAWELYNVRMARARKVLEEANDTENPHWYSQMLTIAYAQRWPSKNTMELFEEAVRKEPYYYTHYFRVANRLAPRWGGTLKEFHTFVEKSVTRTRGRDGSTMYARLYWILAAIEWNQDPFSVLGIPWVKMRQGFDDLMKRYPDSQWNLNHYAYFACRANDVKTFGRLVIGIRKPIDQAWSGSYSLDYCKELLLQRI
jgi:hypothetical protein